MRPGGELSPQLRRRVISIDPIGSTADQDFEPFVTFYRRRQADLIFVASTEIPGIPLLRTARRLGLEIDRMGGDSWMRIVTDTAASEGAYVGTPFNPLASRPAAQQFVQRFRAAYKTDPDGNAHSRTTPPTY